MPHTTIEYSANVSKYHDVDALVDSVHGAMIDLDLAGLGAYRTRAAQRDTYRVADGNSNYAFVAMTVRIGPGRSAETKKLIMKALLDRAERQLGSEHSPLRIAWSIEVQEIDADFRENRNHVAAHLAESETSPLEGDA